MAKKRADTSQELPRRRIWRAWDSAASAPHTPYVEVARRAGIALGGVGLPGHGVVGHFGQAPPLLLDPFGGPKACPHLQLNSLRAVLN